MERIGQCLRALAIVGDGRVVAAWNGTRGGGRSRVAPCGAEETFNGHPEFPGGLLAAFHGEVEDGIINGAEHPDANAAVRLIPLWPEGIGCCRRSGAIDVRLKAEFAAHRFEE